jgi:hypothetical protein
VGQLASLDGLLINHGGSGPGPVIDYPETPAIKRTFAPLGRLTWMRCDAGAAQIALEGYLEDIAIVVDRYADFRHRSAAIGEACHLDTNGRAFVPCQCSDSIAIGT